MRNQPSRTDLIKIVQTGRRALGLDEETYRDMLENLTGLRSCGDKNMTPGKLALVAKHMRDCGFTPKRTPPAASSASAGLPGPLVTQGQLALVHVLWGRMYDFGVVRNGSSDALNTYCRRMLGIPLAACTMEGCQKLIECLKKWWRRAADPDAVAILEDMVTGERHVLQ